MDLPAKTSSPRVGGFLAGDHRGAFSFLLAALALFGLLSIAYLLALPSDPEGSLVGRYSGNRLILLTGPIALLAVCSILISRARQDRRWGEAVGRRLLGEGNMGARLLALTIAVGGAGLAAILFLRPGWILEFNEYKLERLLPYVAFPAVFFVLLWVAGRAASAGVHLRLSSRGRDAACATVLFLTSLASRYPLSGFALPYTGVYDEVVTYAPALARMGGDEAVVDKDISLWGRAGYGELLIGITTVAEVFGFLDGLRTQRVYSLEDFVAPTPGVATIWEGVHPSGIPLQYPRTVFALLNSCGPALVFLGARRYLRVGRPAALAAGLLLALGSRDVLLFSPFILPDSLAMTISIGVVMCSLEIMSDAEGSLKWYGLAGALVGLASATVLRYAILAGFPFIAYLLGPNRSRPGVKAGVLASGALAAFFLVSPGYLVDLPRQLVRLAGNDWYHNRSIANRARSIAFYLKGLFDPSFEETWFKIPVGEAGFGIVTLGLALTGLTRMASTRPRQAIFFLTISAVYLWWVSPIQSRATRHALVLAPVVCFLAARGVEAIVEGLRIGTVAVVARRPGAPDPRGRGAADRGALPWIVAAGIALAFAGRVRGNLMVVREMAAFKTSQQRMAEFLDSELGPSEVVGILDLVPFDTAELFRRGITFVRIEAGDGLQVLQDRGIDVVVGSDLTSFEYPSIAGTIWDTAFDGPDDRIAEFGEQPLVYRGEPKPMIYLFAARIPPR